MSVHFTFLFGKGEIKKKKRLTRNAGIFRERFQLFC